jgi:hypothetical protein
MSNLNAERGPIHVHVGATIIVEGAAPTYDQLVAHIEKRCCSCHGSGSGS